MNCQYAASASSTVSCWELLSDCAVLFNTTRDKVADIDPVKSDMRDADDSDSGKTCCPCSEENQFNVEGNKIGCCTELAIVTGNETWTAVAPVACKNWTELVINAGNTNWTEVVTVGCENRTELVIVAGNETWTEAVVAGAEVLEASTAR